jgi:ABC-2 type transport system permease protein
MKVLYKRELYSFFVTGTGYVFLFVYMVLSGIFFYFGNILTRFSDLSGYYSMATYIWILLIPILTMRLTTEDRKNGTYKLLLSSAISIHKIVLAKYLAALSVIAVGLLLSVIFPIIVAVYGALYIPETLLAYTGMLLYGAAYLAFDMFVSSFAKGNTSAFMLTLGANLLLRVIGLASKSASSGLIKGVLSLLDTEKRFTPFLYGQLSFACIIYFLLFILINILLTAQINSMDGGYRA